MRLQHIFILGMSALLSTHLAYAVSHTAHAAKKATSRQVAVKETHKVSAAKPSKHQVAINNAKHSTKVLAAKSAKPVAHANRNTIQKMEQAMVAKPNMTASRQQNKMAIARIDSSLQVALRQEPSHVMASN